MRGETCVSSVSVPVPEESPFFVVFLGKKAFCKPLLFILMEKKKVCYCKQKYARSNTDWHCIELFVGLYGVKMGTKKLVARIYP